jgi:hypothetical protein
MLSAQSESAPVKQLFPRVFGHDRTSEHPFHNFEPSVLLIQTPGPPPNGAGQQKLIEDP